MKASEIRNAILSGGYDVKLAALYGECSLALQRLRWANAVDSFTALYGDSSVTLISVPGRSEICGNHTDHNHGRVIAAAIDLDIIAVAALSDNNFIRVKSEWFEPDKIYLDDTSSDSQPKFSSAALIAGVLEGFNRSGYKTGAFDAYTTSNVLKGSGLSSSAAFEVAIGSIFSHLFNGGTVEPIEIAKIGQYAENVHFGKPCGLMDQTACAIGGFVAIDFENPSAPIVESIDFDLTAQNYNLCIISTGGSHADLNEDYASIPAEMKAVAAAFGQDVLRSVNYSELLPRIPELRLSLGDRAILRAMHFIDENELVLRQIDNLRSGDLYAFLRGINESGNSSYKKLQNVYTVKDITEQGLALALAICERALKGAPHASRIHGGGFAGTILVFAPNSAISRLASDIDSVFGEGACVLLSVRKDGAVVL